MDALERNYFENLIVVQFHVWWPNANDPFYLASIGDDTTRNAYYNNGYVPHLFFDGFLDGGSNYEDETWINIMSERVQVESPLEITLDIDFDGTNGSVDGHISAEEEIQSSDLVVHFVLFQSEIEYRTPDNVTYYRTVMRKMLPDAHGEPITIQMGETLNVSRDFTLQPDWVPEHCGIVCFVQDNVTREIFQTAKSRFQTNLSTMDYHVYESEGNGNGNFEDGETVSVSLSLRNHGPLASGTSIRLVSQDPDITVLESQIQIGDIPLNSTVDNTDEPLVFQLGQNVVGHYTILINEIRANGGAFFIRDSLEIQIGTPVTLLVNDDHIPPINPWDYDAERFYEMALYDRREAYHLWNTKISGTPDATVLSAYDFVIWFTGVSDPTLTEDDVASLTSYLNGGGNLFISGQDIASDLQGSAFLSDYLHAGFVADSSSDIWLDPVPENRITGELDMLTIVSGNYGASNQNSPDEIEPLEGAELVLTFHNSQKAAAIQYFNDYKVIFFSVGFESIIPFADVLSSFDMRAEMVQQILGWFRYEKPQIGDVNQDGQINIVDVIWVVNVVLGIRQPSPEQEWAADTNQDGTVNIIDAITLVNMILVG